MIKRSTGNSKQLLYSKHQQKHQQQQQQQQQWGNNNNSNNSNSNTTENLKHRDASQASSTNTVTASATVSWCVTLCAECDRIITTCYLKQLLLVLFLPLMMAAGYGNNNSSNSLFKLAFVGYGYSSTGHPSSYHPAFEGLIMCRRRHCRVGRRCCC